MEKKTIGQFISALRRANGLTQKELAERLNVSDKAVSRWERDECSPDISLIPIIADIFGVTSDELLRGERASVSHAKAASDNEVNPAAELPLCQNNLSAKSEREIKYILNSALTKYKAAGIICVGLSFIGLLIAAVINCSFNRAYLGFGIGASLCIIAIIMIIVNAIKTFSSVSIDNSDEFSGIDINSFKKSIKNIIWLLSSIIAIITSALIPLLSVPDGYFGLSLSSWADIYFSFIFLAAVILCAAAGFIMECICGTNKQSAKKITVICVILLAVTFAIQAAFNIISDEKVLFAKPIVFDNVKDFISYMETPVKNGESSDDTFSIRVTTTDASCSDSDYSDYDEITDIYGNVINQYYHLNEDVTQISYHYNKIGVPDIFYVYTYSEVQKNINATKGINNAFIALYLLEIFGSFLAYKKKSTLKSTPK